MPDLRQGCATGKPSEDTTPTDALVLFGAMGDLAHKKIFPALYHMVQHGHLEVAVIGVARAAEQTNISKRTCATASSSKAATSIKQPWPSFSSCFDTSAVTMRKLRPLSC